MSLVARLQHDGSAGWPKRGRSAARASKRAAVLASMLCVGALCVGAVAATDTGAATRQIGETRVFATVPYPGNPGGLLVSGQTLYVDTSGADFDREFDGKDDIFAYDLPTGQLLAEGANPIVVTRQSPVATMGLAGIAQDAEGRLYVADMNGRIVRVDPRTGAQSVYATFPTGTYTSFTDMPVFLAFTGDGSLYVGEAAGPPVVWRVPPGGGEAQPWFVDPRLSGTYAASVLGVAVDPSRRELYFAAGNQDPGIVIYRLPFAHPDAAHLQVFHRYSDVVITPCQPEPNFNPPNCAIAQLLGAGGIAFGKSGKLYVALFAKNQVSILAPDGTEEARFPSPEENAQRAVPLDGPLGLAFDGRGSLLVANVGEPTFGYGPGGTLPPGGLPSSSSWVVFDSFVNDTTSPLIRPVIP
jgi:DNA-binding beta-propeller fold protein YncE